MWMNSANRVEQSEAVSPLTHDIKGAFSRKGKPLSREKTDPLWLDTLLIIVYIFSLLAMDFIAFAGSGYMNVFDGSLLPIPEVSLILLCIFGVTATAIILCHQNREAKYVIAAVVTALIAYVITRQFFQYHQDFMIGDYPVPVTIIVSLLLGGLTFVIFYQKERVLYRVLYIMVFFIMFLNTYFSHYFRDKNHDFEEIYNTQEQTEQKDKRFIYFMFPNFAPYSYLSKIGNDEAVKTQEIMQGFFRKNKFKVFDRAYTPEVNYTGNVIRSLNPSINKSSAYHRMNTKLLDRYWRLHNLRSEYIFLQNNELYDLFNKAKFQISAYKSRDVDMCRKDHKFNVNRCVEKVNKPVDLYHSNLSVSSRAKILAIEWFTSMRLSKDASFVYNVIGLFKDPDEIEVVKIDFNNLYVINAPKTFDVVFDNIKKDKGKQAYMVFVDMPSNLYAYDEFCHIKHPYKWVTMSNLPWVTKEYKTERQSAYLQQTRCLFGKLEQFMENLKQEDMLKNSIIVIQGVSGVNDFEPFTTDASADKFIGSRIVNMAIYDETHNDYEIDDRFCATSQILTEYLYPNRKCGADITGYHQKIVDQINEDLAVLNQGIDNDTVSVFDNWYKTWKVKEAETATEEMLMIEPLEEKVITDEDMGLNTKVEESTEKTEEEPEEKSEAPELNKGVFDDVGDLFEQE